METPISVQQLIEAGVHFGCRASRWNPRMAPYIYGRRNAIHVIDLRQTMRGIFRAQNLLFRIASEGQTVLWVGTKRQVKGVIADAGERTGMPIVTERWIGGTLTNFSVIRSRLRRLEELEGLDEKAIEDAKLTKKEIATLAREKRKIMRNLGGIREMSSLPGAMIVVDPSREVNAAKEARKMGIVTIGLLDTDCDPSDVDIVIPCNDDALKSVRLVIEQLVSQVEAGWHQHSENVAAMGAAEKHSEEPSVTDEVRPTRSQRAPRRKPEEGEAGASEAPAEAPAEPSGSPAPAEAPTAAAAPPPSPPEGAPAAEKKDEVSTATPVSGDGEDKS